MQRDGRSVRLFFTPGPTDASFSSHCLLCHYIPHQITPPPAPPAAAAVASSRRNAGAASVLSSSVSFSPVTSSLSPSLICNVTLACRSQAQKGPGSNHAVVTTVSGNSLRQTVHTHRASVHRAAKLVAALLRVAGVTAGLVESNGSLPAAGFMTHLSGRLTAKNRDQLRNPPSMGYLYLFLFYYGETAHGGAQWKNCAPRSRG